MTTPIDYNNYVDLADRIDDVGAKVDTLDSDLIAAAALMVASKLLCPDEARPIEWDAENAWAMLHYLKAARPKGGE